MVKISIFIKKSAYELVSLMSSHTDQVDRCVNNLDNMAPHCGAKKGSIIDVKKAVFALISRLIRMFNQFLC